MVFRYEVTLGKENRLDVWVDYTCFVPPRVDYKIDGYWVGEGYNPQ